MWVTDLYSYCKKTKAIYYVKALENSLQRMKTGRNRTFSDDSLTGRFTDWLQGSVCIRLKPNQWWCASKPSRLEESREECRTDRAPDGLRQE